MTLRTRESVEAGVVWSESIAGSDLGGKGLFIEYQPGSGTRYPVIIQRVELSPKAGPMIGFSPFEHAGTFLFVWLHGAPGRAHVWRDEGFLHWTQVAEHLQCHEADARVLAELIAHYTNRTAESAEEPTGPPPCSACRGTGNEFKVVTGVCPECDGECVRRASAL